MLIMTAYLAVSGVFDYLFHKIPNALILMMLVTCFIYTCLTEGPAGIIGMILRMILTVLFFYPFFKIGALGAGDVKLLAVCCGFMTGTRAVWFVFISFAVASVAGVIGLFLKKEFGKRIRRLSLYINTFIKTGKPGRYHCNSEAALKAGIALAGPMFISALIGIGGLY